MSENVIIIGGGPAGLSAAIYLARANLTPLLFAGSPPGGQLTLTSEVENYPGYESILGSDLIEKMRNQAKKFGTRIIDQNILKVNFTKKPFEVFLSTSEKDSPTSNYTTKAVIIATGAKALWLNLPSETRLRGHGVSACATCDGFFYRNQEVAVIGGGNTAVEEALYLANIASKVTLVHRRDKFKAEAILVDKLNARVAEGKIVDALIKKERSKAAIKKMHQIEVKLTLRRKKISAQLLKAAQGSKEKKLLNEQLNKLNSVMDEVCFFLRQP